MLCMRVQGLGFIGLRAEGLKYETILKACEKNKQQMSQDSA